MDAMKEWKFQTGASVEQKPCDVKNEEGKEIR